jgi:hypothetical protein
MTTETSVSIVACKTMLLTLLQDNETKAVQYCCVAKERNNVVLVHCYDATETVTHNNIIAVTGLSHNLLVHRPCSPFCTFQTSVFTRICLVSAVFNVLMKSGN